MWKWIYVYGIDISCEMFLQPQLIAIVSRERLQE